MSKSILTLHTGKTSLTLPLKKAIWIGWRALSYPLAITAGYHFFGQDGAIFTTIILVLTFRGDL